jgi:hypothetical protein
MNIENNKNVIIVKKTRDIIEIVNNINLNTISNNAYSFIHDNMSEEIATEQIKKCILETLE